jgi:hypothetical protein
MSFGYSYWINTETDPDKKSRKFELDIKYTPKEYQRQFTTSYHAFTKRYSDENFDGCQYDDPYKNDSDDDYSSRSSDKSFFAKDHEFEDLLEKDKPESLTDLQEEVELEEEPPQHEGEEDGEDEEEDDRLAVDY